MLPLTYSLKVKSVIFHLRDDFDQIEIHLKNYIQQKSKLLQVVVTTCKEKHVKTARWKIAYRRVICGANTWRQKWHPMLPAAAADVKGCCCLSFSRACKASVCILISRFWELK